MILVSVIVPIYKVEQYLPKCIESVLGQTYTEFELILVDDGSPDQCSAICDNYADKDRRIQVVHKENGGLSSARNAGLEVARGKYIYFLDGDDYIAPELLEIAVDYMERGLDMVVFNHYCVEEETDYIITQSHHQTGEYQMENDEGKKNFIYQVLMAEKFGWEAWNRVFRRSIIERNNIRFADNRTIFAEDLYFSLCYCVKAVRIVSITRCLYYYLKRKNSIMGIDAQKSNIGRMSVLAKEVYSYWEKQDDCQYLLNIFPAIYFQIINNAVVNLRRSREVHLRELRTIFLIEIEDLNFALHQINAIVKDPTLLYQTFSGSKVAEIRSSYKYIINGRYYMAAVRNRLIYKFPRYLDAASPEVKERNNKLKLFSRVEKCIYFLGTEEFGNIGDHQINESICDFLKECMPDYSIIEITLRQFSDCFSLLKKIIKPEDIIVLPGGGNTGDEYPVAENTREKIISEWPENKKIVFPQTIFFKDTEEGKCALERAQKVYVRENNLTFATRDKASYSFAKNYFSCDCILAPDIVLYNSKQGNSEKKEQILICIREDVEGRINNSAVLSLTECSRKYCRDIFRIDTQLDYNISKDGRRTAAQEYIEYWQSTGLVITDRLHGLIFSAITATPCIALGNYNHKVKGAYEWLSYLPYIKFADTLEEAKRYIPELLSMKDCKYDITPLRPYFERIEELLKG